MAVPSSFLAISRFLVSLALTCIFLWQCHKAFDNLLSTAVASDSEETYQGCHEIKCFVLKKAKKTCLYPGHDGVSVNHGLSALL